MAKKIKKNNVLAIAIMSLEEAATDLSRIRTFADRDIGGTPKTIQGFRKALSENLSERIDNIHVAIAKLKDEHKGELRIDAEVLDGAGYRLKSLGEFIIYMFEITRSDISLKAPNITIDSIFNLAKNATSDFNEIAEKMNEAFYGLDLEMLDTD